MSGTRTYLLTNVSFNMILAKKRKCLGDNRRLYDDFGASKGKIECRKCRKEITVGQRIVSKMFGHTSRIYYHYECAERLNIV